MTFILVGGYVGVVIICTIAAIWFSIEDGYLSLSDGSIIFLAIIFWPITLIVIAVVIFISNYEKIKRKVLGRYWTIRAKLSRDEDGSIWDR